MRLRSRLTKLEKKLGGTKETFTIEDWTFEELIELVDNPTPELEEKESRTVWGDFLKELEVKEDN